MATIYWNSSVKKGDWAVAANWIGGAVPGIGDDAIIDGQGRLTISIDTPAAVHSLVLGDARARVNDTQTLTLGGPLTVERGTFALYGAGRIVGGTLSATKGVFQWGGGVLDGVKYDGALVLPTFQSVIVTDGFTAAGARGAGPGVIDVTGDNALFEAAGGQTLDNMTVNIGAPTNAYNDLEVYNPTDATPVLTLGQHFSMVQTGAYAAIAQSSAFIDNGIVNDGVLTADLAGGTFFVSPFNFTNDGVIGVGGGDALKIASTSVVNGADGAITVNGAGTSLVMGVGTGAVTNLGAITLGAGAAGAITTGVFSNSGSVAAAGGGTPPFALTATTFVNAASGLIAFGGPGEVARFDDPGGQWSNAGTIAFGAGTTGYIDVEGPGSWTNPGAITVGSGAAVHLQGALGTDLLGGFDNSGGVVLIEGTLAGGGSIEVGSGTNLGAVGLEATGLIENVTVIANAAGLVCDGGALAGVTYEGLLDLSAADAVLGVIGGLTGAVAAPASIDLTGADSLLTATGGGTFDVGALNIGADSAGAVVEVLNPGDTAPTLTFGSAFAIVQTGRLASIEDGSNFANDTMVNDGSITAAVAGGAFTLTSPSFINNGAILIDGGDSFAVNCSTFANGGSISVAGGATALLGEGGRQWSNTGVIALDTGATGEIGVLGPGTLTNPGTITIGADADLLLDGPLTLAAFDNISNSGGSVTIDGTLTSNGGGLAIGTGTQLGTLVLGRSGEISDVRLIDSGAGLEFAGGTLEFVTYQGVVDLSAANASVSVLLDLMAVGAGGSGPGVIDLTGDNSSLIANGADGTLNFDNATLNIGNNLGFSYFSLETPYTYGGLLTFHSQFNIVQTGLLAEIRDIGINPSAAIVDDGAITAMVTGGSFYISGDMSFTNNGVITVGDGDSLFIQTLRLTNNGEIIVGPGGYVDLATTAFTDLKTSTLTGGVYEVGGAATLELYRNRAIVTDDATIILDGKGSTIQSRRRGTTEVAIDATLAAIGAGGVLDLLGGRDWTSSLAFSNSGTLQLGGGTFSVASLSETVGATLTGFGVVSAAFTDSGAAIAVGGALDLTQAVTGAGSLKITAGATLEVDASTAASLTAVFTGADATLAIGAPSDFAATIAGFAPGQTIDLLATAASSAMLGPADKLFITNGSVAVATLQLSGDYGGEVFTTVSDDRGGTNIVVGPPSPGSPRAFAAAMAGFGADPAATGAVCRPPTDPPHPPLVLPRG